MKKEYTEEKEAIASKLYDILELKNNYFLLCELDEDLIKQEKIMNLVPEIERYFKSRDLSYLHVKCIKKKRPYLSLIRGIFKNCNYKIILQSITNKYDNKIKRTQKYYIIKPNEAIIF
jgi:hypothetical protein